MLAGLVFTLRRSASAGGRSESLLETYHGRMTLRQSGSEQGLGQRGLGRGVRVGAGRIRRWIAVITPGLLVAATGVGAGDLATGGIAGSKLGVAILWAVMLGAIVKFILSEGLARWQLATGQTVLEGAVHRLGWIVIAIFAVYLVPWTFFTAAAMMSACGITMHAILPLADDPALGKVIWGVIHSAVGVMLVWWGGFRAFERVMGACIAIMFVTVVVTAVLLGPDVGAMIKGLLLPRIPDFRGEGLIWTIALMGGVGGTLTIICYGYWMREVGRRSQNDLRTCRIDLAVGYGATALFGMSMIVIASRIEVSGTGANLIVNLALQLESTLGSAGRWLFLIGAWAAVFSSLLGVWQAVPYVFADFVGAVARRRRLEHAVASTHVVNTSSRLYRGFVLAMATLPIIQLMQPFKTVQQYYAVLGACFIPMLGLVLLILNSQRRFIGENMRNSVLTNAALVLVLLLAGIAAAFEIARGGE